MQQKTIVRIGTAIKREGTYCEKSSKNFLKKVVVEKLSVGSINLTTRATNTEKLIMTTSANTVSKVFFNCFNRSPPFHILFAFYSQKITTTDLLYHNVPKVAIAF